MQLEGTLNRSHYVLLTGIAGRLKQASIRRLFGLLDVSPLIGDFAGTIRTDLHV